MPTLALTHSSPTFPCSAFLTCIDASSRLPCTISNQFWEILEHPMCSFLLVAWDCWHRGKRANGLLAIDVGPEHIRKGSLPPQIPSITTINTIITLPNPKHRRHQNNLGLRAPVPRSYYVRSRFATTFHLHIVIPCSNSQNELPRYPLSLAFGPPTRHQPRSP